MVDLKLWPSFIEGGFIDDRTTASIEQYGGDPWVWLKFCADCWDETHGRINRCETDNEKRIEFITGGWSCNELVIEAMKYNAVMWALCWESSHRGGLFRFKVLAEHPS